MVRSLWETGTSTVLPLGDEIEYIEAAFYHVESLDYPKSNTATFSNSTFVFGTTPTDISCMLYVYKALELIGNAVSNKKSFQDGVGVNFKAGIDQIDTRELAKIVKNSTTTFSNQYKKALRRAYTMDSSAAVIDLYSD